MILILGGSFLGGLIGLIAFAIYASYNLPPSMILRTHDWTYPHRSILRMEN